MGEELTKMFEYSISNELPVIVFSAFNAMAKTKALSESFDAACSSSVLANPNTDEYQLALHPLGISS